MPFISINYWAVLAAAILQMIIGMIWYSPRVFGSTWLESLGKRLEDLKRENMGARYATAFVGSLVTAYVLANVVGYFGAVTVGQGIAAGFWIWLGFVATMALGGMLWEERSVRWYAITVGYQLVALSLMGALLAVWA